MTNNNDLIDLYSKRILALAADIEHTKRLDNPDSTVKKRSPMCGSMVTVDICLNENKVVDYGHEVKACALGQAAASVISKSIIGSDVDQILTAREELIDIWHFLIQASLELNLTPDDILKEYQRKNEINRQRQKDGY